MYALNLNIQQAASGVSTHNGRVCTSESISNCTSKRKQMYNCGQMSSGSYSYQIFSVFFPFSRVYFGYEALIPHALYGKIVHLYFACPEFCHSIHAIIELRLRCIICSKRSIRWCVCVCVRFWIVGISDSKINVARQEKRKWWKIIKSRTETVDQCVSECNQRQPIPQTHKNV